jgi:4-hydroxy-tetrahydrodipicolinate reductase
MINKKKVKIGIVGVSGRMGKSIVLAAKQYPNVIISSGSEYKKHKDIGKDIGVLVGEKPLGIKVTSDHDDFCKDINVIIEFGLEKATNEYLSLAKRKKIAFISGSTALKKKTLQAMKLASKHIPVFWAPNMSLGANLISLLSKIATKKLGKDFDIDITDLHHRNKKDSPSGTANLIKAEIKDSLKEIKLENKIVNISALRSGDSTGEHSVIFSGEGERITIKHISTSRVIFANGAIKIAAWLYKKKKGLYTMSDYLKI